MTSDMAADELREAVEHIQRARRLSPELQGGWTDRKLIDATGSVRVVLDREFGVSGGGE